MTNRWLKIVNYFLFLSMIGLALWLINLNFPQSGFLLIQAKAGQNQPMLSQLGPEPRIKISQDNQIILEGPVYFDLRAMPWFSTANIYLIYKEGDQGLEGIAGKLGPGWHYKVEPALAISDLDNGYKKAVFRFSLNKFYQEKNVTRFLVSTLPAESEIAGLEIKQLKIILER
jgi:hypothetical protein